jgi:succinate dehydrogenase/fumarate reductase flavoprotein subunit
MRLRSTFYACSLVTDRVRAKKNIQIFLQTPEKNLSKIGDKVTGVVAQDANGNELRVKAKAVIIITGGFSGNPEMTYASTLCCDNFGGVGGIRINSKTEVLNTNGESIPGLYAGGHDANTMYADTDPAYESGNLSSFAYTTGLLAAKSAARYVKSLG